MCTPVMEIIVSTRGCSRHVANALDGHGHWTHNDKQARLREEDGGMGTHDNVTVVIEQFLDVVGGQCCTVVVVVGQHDGLGAGIEILDGPRCDVVEAITIEVVAAGTGA